jgi:hypothetical protein
MLPRAAPAVCNRNSAFAGKKEGGAEAPPSCRVLSKRTAYGAVVHACWALSYSG